MSIRTIKVGLYAALLAGTICADVSANLINPSFDDNGGSLDGWTTFNNGIPNVVAAPITPRSPTDVAKIFGGFNGNPNYSGLLQSLPASPGQIWTASCYARHNSGDALSGSNRLVMKIEFYNVPGGVYGTADMLLENELLVLDQGSPTDQWLPASFPVTAPVGTVEARIALVFIQVDNQPGAGLLDDVSFTADSDPPDPPSGDAWRLLWHDEFEGSSIDPSKWRVEDLHLIKNAELQYYAPDDVYLENGRLILRSQERLYYGLDQNGQWNWYYYTSGLVESKERFDHTYGRVEVRAKLPSTQGLWPAHWMLPASGAWPPEIDIMELLGHEPEQVYMTHHWGTWPDVQSHGGSFVGPDFSQDFHTFAIEWSPGRIEWFVDDARRFVSTTSIPAEPFYVILNTAVGGNWPGNPDGSTVLPQYHEIEYVRWLVPGRTADFNGDEAVDWDDFNVFSQCAAGPGNEPAPLSPLHPVECQTVFDFDDDEDVDMPDFAVFQQEFGQAPAS